MPLIDKIRNLCKFNGISVTKLEVALGYGNGSITKNTTIRSDRIRDIANHFGVTPTYLMTDMVYNVCPVCAAAFNPLDEKEISLHQELHNNYLKLRDKMGYLLNPTQAANKRIVAMSSLEQSDVPDDGKVFHYETLVQCDFAEYAFMKNFVVDISYADFIRDELKERKYFDLIPPLVIKNLTAKYNVELSSDDVPLIELFQKDKEFMSNITDLWDLPQQLRYDVYKAIRHAKRDYADREYYTNPYANISDSCYDYDSASEKCRQCQRGPKNERDSYRV